MKYSALLIAAVMLMAVHQGLAKNTTYSWQLGGVSKADGSPRVAPETDPICLEQGDFVIFKWVDEGPLHNAYSTTNMKAATICDKAAAKKEVATAPTGTYIVDAKKKGKAKFGIICTIGSHCVGGMNAVIEVKGTGEKCPAPKR